MRGSLTLLTLQVMKDWSDLEERYQDMRAEDPAQAEDFKKQMTERFQKTVQALEEESSAEKRQLLAMHQQRVISRWTGFLTLSSAPSSSFLLTPFQKLLCPIFDLLIPFTVYLFLYLQNF